MNELRLGVNEWSVRAISPVEFSPDMGATKDPVALIFPGWGCAAEYHEDALETFLDNEILPISVDTRYGVSDRRQGQRYRHVTDRIGEVAGRQDHVSSDPSLREDISSVAQNRWEARRVEGVQGLIEWAGLDTVTGIGYSEGARMAILNAHVNSDAMSHVVLVNSPGVARGEPDQITEGTKKVTDYTNTSTLRQFIRAGKRSSLYVAHDLRRTMHEASVIFRHDYWEDIDLLTAGVVDVTMMQADQDNLVTLSVVEQKAKSRPEVALVKTSGDHGNITTKEVIDRLVHSVKNGHDLE